MKHFIDFFVLLCFLLPPQLSHAQMADEPIYFLHEDILWRWTLDDGLVQVGDPLPHVVSYLLSPRADKIAIETHDPRVQAFLDEECPCGGTTPTGAEYWIIDLASGEQTEIAAQPEDMESANDAIYRRSLLWSPDGSMLAWAEGLEYSDIQVYDIATGETRLAAEDVPSQSRVSNVTALTRWTPTGIWVENIDFSNNDVPNGYDVYGLNGEIVAHIPPYKELAGLPNVQSNLQSSYDAENSFDVLDNGVDTLVTHSEEGWQTYVVATGETTPLTAGVIVRASRLTPETSLRVYPSSADYGADLPVIRQDVSTADGELLTRIGYFGGMSPSGSAIITNFSGSGDHYDIMRADGSTYTIELPWTTYGVIWGATSLYLERDVEHVLANATCDGGTLPFRFSTYFNGEIDTAGHVLGSGSLLVHGEPSAESRSVGEIAAGESFVIVGSPSCANGSAWWPIEAQSGVQGWILEGVGDTYQLAPGCSVDYCESKG